jgi:hypothetical protein
MNQHYLPKPNDEFSNFQQSEILTENNNNLIGQEERMGITEGPWSSAESDLFKKIENLPDELRDYIRNYLPDVKFVFTNRMNYRLFHRFLTPYIKRFENYIRDTIRRDNEFVFDRIIRENYSKWQDIKNYRYKNMIFKNYLYFVIHYSIENDSSNCRKVITAFTTELGLCKNLHKKNVVRYIR